MDQKGIDRINTLARKAKAEGLTDAEREEQRKLRRQFIMEIRMSVKSQLDNIDMVEPDGSIVNLGDKYGDKTVH